MLTIARLFGKSPFAPLQTHMDKVASCVGQLEPLFAALSRGDEAAIESISCLISTLEHEADLTKNDIRNHLPRSLFLPVDRAALLDILSLQDRIADQVEAIAFHAAIRPASLPPESYEHFQLLCNKTLESFWLARQVIKELDELLESAFGGIEAEKVKGMVEQIAFMEHEGTESLRLVMKALYLKGDKMSHTAFHHAVRLVEQIGAVATLSEKLGNRIRMLLELK
jgi:predicted phosphate transport protein (TIGR00153 family)